MISTIKIFLLSAKLSFARRMAYRADFLLCFIVMMITEFALPIFGLVIYKRGSSFPGWTLDEYLLIQGIYMFSRGVTYTLFIGMMFNVFYSVRHGSFDIMLIRPRSPLLLCMTETINVHDSGKILGGIALIAYSIRNIPRPDFMQWLQFIILMIMSLVLMFSLIVVMTSMVFRWVGVDKQYQIFNSFVDFGLYPRSIFPNMISTIISYIVPVVVIAYIPASVLLGRPTEGILISIVMAFVFLGFSLFFWNCMVRSYTSAGG